MHENIKKKSYYLALFLMACAWMLNDGTGQAQILDADCFSGDCEGRKGIPQCPAGFDEVGFVLPRLCHPGRRLRRFDERSVSRHFGFLDT